MGTRRAALLVALAWLVVALPLLHAFGPTWDAVLGPFPYGNDVLDWVANGDGDFVSHAESKPQPQMRAPYPAFHPRRDSWYTAFPLFAVLSALSNALLWNTWGWVPATSAHLLVVPLAMALLLYALVGFAARNGAGLAAGVAGAVLLVASPRVFGHALSNLKDVPGTLLFALTMFALYRALTATGRGDGGADDAGRRDDGDARVPVGADVMRWAVVGLLAGLAAAQKPNAAFLPVQALAFVVLARVPGLAGRGESAPRIPLVGLVAAVLVGLGVWLGTNPAFYSDPVGHVGEHLRFYLAHNTQSDDVAMFDSDGSRWLGMAQILWTTPWPVLLLAPLGLVLGRAPRRLRVFVAIGVAEPALRTALPGWPEFDGIRHVLELQPFLALAAGMGVVVVAGWVAARVSTRSGDAASRALSGAAGGGADESPGLARGGTSGSSARSAVLVACVFAAALPGVLATARTFPLSTCWFNEVVGGVAGARAAEVEDATDF